MGISDTTPEAAAIQIEALRRMGASKRIQLAVEMTELVRDCQKRALERQHPEYSSARISAELLELRYGLSRPRE